MAKLVWTEEAVRWLENIFEYIAEDNPQAAGETIQGIYDRAQALIDFPEMGQRIKVPSARFVFCSMGITESRIW